MRIWYNGVAKAKYFSSITLACPFQTINVLSEYEGVCVGSYACDVCVCVSVLQR